MTTLLSFLLLAQLFTPARGQATPPPVEVLDAEVRMQELRTRARPNPRDARPPGAVGSERIPGVREKAIKEQPSIEDRSVELGKVARRADVLGRSPGGYIYEYRARVRNNSPKKIESIVWEYQITNSTATVSQRVFFCSTTIKAGGVKQLAARTYAPPNRVVSASNDEPQKQNAIVNRVEFSDGSTWTRDGWKQDAAAPAKTRDLSNDQCTML